MRASRGGEDHAADTDELQRCSRGKSPELDPELNLGPGGRKESDDGMSFEHDDDSRDKGSSLGGVYLAGKMRDLSEFQPAR